MLFASSDSRALSAAGGRLTFLYPTTVGYSPELLPMHPCLSLAQDCPGEALTPFLSRRIITMTKVSDYVDSDSPLYRAAATSAGERAGTLRSALRDRMSEAYDHWFAERMVALPAMVQQLKRPKPPRAPGSDVEAAGSRDGAAACFPAATAAVDASAVEIHDPELHQAPSPAISRGQLKKEARRVVRQLRRAEKLQAAAATAASLPSGTETGTLDDDAPGASGAKCTPAELDQFASAVGWKRSRRPNSATAASNSPLHSDAGGVGEAVAAPADAPADVMPGESSRRSRLKQRAAHKVAGMLSGAVPFHIGQIPFSALPAPASPGPLNASAQVPFVHFGPRPSAM
jgi:hypothetical protein